MMMRFFENVKRLRSLYRSQDRIIDALHGRAPYPPGESDIRGASAGRSRCVRCAS